MTIARGRSFLYVPFTMPHANNELGSATGDGMEIPDRGQYEKETWPSAEKGFAAMVTRMDADIGKILAILKSAGLENDTIVFFTSDNGPHHEGGHDAAVLWQLRAVARSEKGFVRRRHS